MVNFSASWLAARTPGGLKAWLVFGTDKRLEEGRGQPLLSLVLQSLKEIDRYRDSVQRKTLVDSFMAIFIKKTNDKPSTFPFRGGSQRRGEDTSGSQDAKDSNESPRKFNIATQIPGMIIEELQTGEEPILKGGEGTDVNFGTFEESILRGVAWAHEVPPEIPFLSFTNNYSAS